MLTKKNKKQKTKNKKQKKNGGSNNNSNNSSDIINIMIIEWRKKMTELLVNLLGNNSLIPQEIMIFFKYKLEIDKKNMDIIIDNLPENGLNSEKLLIKKQIYKKLYENTKNLPI